MLRAVLILATALGEELPEDAFHHYALALQRQGPPNPTHRQKQTTLRTHIHILHNLNIEISEEVDGS